jgi:hypothetical protein
MQTKRCLKSPVVVNNPACSEVSRSILLQDWRFNASIGRDVQWFLYVPWCSNRHSTAHSASATEAFIHCDQCFFRLPADVHQGRVFLNKVLIAGRSCY